MSDRTEERANGREAVGRLTERLIEHEQALRRQAHEEGADRRPRTTEELHQTATKTARRYDRKYEDG